MEKVEFLILRNLLHDEEYLRKVLPFIKNEYFEDSDQKIVFEEISKFVLEYNNIPTKEILCIEIEKRVDINEDQFKKLIHLVSHLESIVVEKKWLLDTTEKWCRDRAIYLALMESIHIADGDDKKSPDAIPSILQDALAVSFDNHVGHDYLGDYEKRYAYVHTQTCVYHDCICPACLQCLRAAFRRPGVSQHRPHPDKERKRKILFFLLLLLWRLHHR
jgi:hypothetical protein